MKIVSFSMIAVTALSAYLVFADMAEVEEQTGQNSQLFEISRKLETSAHGNKTVAREVEGQTGQNPKLFEILRKLETSAHGNKTEAREIQERIAVTLGLSIFGAVMGTANLLNGLIGGAMTRQLIKEIKEKLNTLDDKVISLSHDVQNVISGQAHLINMASYMDEVTRLQFYLHYFKREIRVEEGVLVPAYQAGEFTDHALDLTSSGMKAVLFNFHKMIMGGQYLASDSILISYESLLDRNSLDYMSKFVKFVDYTLSLQTSGYMLWVNAIQHRGVDVAKEVAYVTALQQERTQKQNQFLSDIGVSWPEGKWGIPKPKSGCPANLGFQWKTGYRYHDTEDSSNANAWSGVNHFLGLGSNLRQEFCMKNGAGKGSWPRGEYCIFVNDVCPAGFNCGWIFWDDEDDSNDNTKSGQVPLGHYTHNTRMYYGCRSDGNVDSQILLPASKPFYLLRYRGKCQQVKYTKVTEEYLFWDNEDSSNIDNTAGAHPYEDGGTRNHKLHYCYYQPDLYKI